MTQPSSAAYWTRQPRAETCWRVGCMNDAAPQSERWQGRYCRACMAWLAETAEREVGKELVG